MNKQYIQLLFHIGSLEVSNFAAATRGKNHF